MLLEELVGLHRTGTASFSVLESHLGVICSLQKSFALGKGLGSGSPDLFTKVEREGLPGGAGAEGGR